MSTAVYKPAIHDIGNPMQQNVNPTVYNSNSIKDEEIIGTTNYDLQTNACLSNRLTLFPDGTLGAVWTLGFEEVIAMPDRGTGYNYFDGTSWGPAPTERIEDDKTGWPNHAPFGENGELVAAHFSGAVNPNNEGIVFHKRDTKGTGEWEFISLLQSPDPVFPTALWPRVVTTGADHSVIHAICTTYPTGNGGGPWQGMDPALLYNRSVDGGATWDPEALILEGMTSNEYTEIGGDSYAFAEPVGDTLAFVVCDTWMTDWFVMKSTDGGDNWDKIIIWEHPFPFFNWTTTIFTDSMWAPDGATDIAIDQNGMVHAVAGLCRVMHETTGTTYSYWPYGEGIVYWNEDMGPFENENQCNALNVWDGILTQDVDLIGWGQDIDNNGEWELIDDKLWTYRTIGANTMPTMTIGSYNQIIVAWAGATETYVGTTPDGDRNYKHVWTRQSHDGGATWTPHFDMTWDLPHIIHECLYPQLASGVDEKVHLMIQIDGDIGLAVDEDHLFHENSMTYFTELYTKIDEINSKKSTMEVSQNYPNPFTKTSEVDVILDKASNLYLEVINMVGQVVYKVDAGYATKGLNRLTIDASELTPGVYFYTVKAGKESVTKKMMIE